MTHLKTKTKSKQYIEQVMTLAPHELWAWLNSNATEYAMVDWDRSLAYSKKYHCKKRACFDNALAIAMRDEDLLYVEGYAHFVIPTEHAWLIDKDGTVIDPTWCLLLDLEDYKPDYFGVHIPIVMAARHYSGDHHFLHAWTKMAEMQMKGESVEQGSKKEAANRNRNTAGRRQSKHI